MNWWSSLFMGLGAFAASAGQIFMPKDPGAGTTPAPKSSPGTAGSFIKKYAVWFAGAAVLIILLLLFARRK